MTDQSKLSRASLSVSLLTFILFVAGVLYINQEVLYTAHDRSEFLYGTPFFDTLTSKPFGLMQYVGAWLTQLLYKPMLGAMMMIAIWILIFCVGSKAFRLQESASALMLLPVACLLTSIVDLGYWVYILPIRGYWFSQSVGYLLMLLLLWFARCTPRKWHLVWYVLGACLYPVLGWLALLFLICLVLADKITWRELVGVVLLLSTTFICHTQIYQNLNKDDVMFAGLPVFETASDSNPNLSYPFWLLGAISALIPLCGKYLSKWFVPLVCAAAGIGYTASQMFYDKNYINEMRMVRYASDDKWKDVITMAEENNSPTTSMIFMKNIALMHEGGLLDRSFAMGNDGVDIYNPDSVHVSFLEIAAPVAYYNYGMFNEGFRLSFECAVQSGFCPAYLKMLARCAQANSEDNLADRYIAQLRHHPFYVDWKPKKASATSIELHDSYQNEITGVESSDGYIVNSISLWYDSDSKLASEQALFFSMLRRDSRRFWASFRTFIKLHMGESFPESVAEAYIMYMDKAPEKKRVMIPVNEELYDRYKQFWNTLQTLLQSGQSREEVTEQMRSQFGDTYWYYNIFSRRVY